jgi:small conductance mechanosensitive channel
VFESLTQAKFVTDFLIPLALRIAYAIVILVVGWLLTKLIVRMVKKYLTRYEIDEILISFVASVTRAVLVLIVIIAALTMLGINTTSLVALIGAAGLAVGLALQDSLKNFASGVMLIIYRPFEVGDYVETSDTQGIVEHITMFTTVLRTPDNR